MITLFPLWCLARSPTRTLKKRQKIYLRLSLGALLIKIIMYKTPIVYTIDQKLKILDATFCPLN
jgi:hypothetical protein